jgi:hypothetical protein
MKYFGDFSDWDDVSSRFGDGEDIPKPDEVIYAEYDNGGYEGSAVVVFRNGKNISMVTGSHCSCFGLEGQWDPETFTIKGAIQYFEHINERGYGIQLDAASKILKKLQKIEES